jgi:hypothetical protein
LSLESAEGVAEFVAFGFEVTLIVRGGGTFEGDLLFDDDAVKLQAAGFEGVVGYRAPPDEDR